MDKQLLAEWLIVISVSSAVIGGFYWYYFENDYWLDSAPDGWYHQRSYIDSYMINDNEIFFPLCDHSYLGPLHGTFRFAKNVDFETEGRYNLKLVNNEIVEAVLYG